MNPVLEETVRPTGIGPVAAACSPDIQKMAVQTWNGLPANRRATYSGLMSGEKRYVAKIDSKWVRVEFVKS